MIKRLNIKPFLIDKIVNAQKTKNKINYQNIDIILNAYIWRCFKNNHDGQIIKKIIQIYL